MIQPLSGWPDFTPSTTTTPTPSPSSCTTKWIIGALFYSHVHPPQLPETPRRARRGACIAGVCRRSVLLGGGVGIPVAGRRGAVDAPRASPRPPAGSGAVGNRSRRGDEVDYFFGRNHCRRGVGPFRPRRGQRPFPGTLVLVPVHDGGRAERGRPYADRTGRRCRRRPSAIRLCFVPAIRAGLLRRLPPYRRRCAGLGGVPRRLHLRIDLGPRPRTQARRCGTLHARRLPRALRPLPFGPGSAGGACGVPVD